jgi:hypothetical protein
MTSVILSNPNNWCRRYPSQTNAEKIIENIFFALIFLGHLEASEFLEKKTYKSIKKTLKKIKKNYFKNLENLEISLLMLEVF